MLDKRFNLENEKEMQKLWEEKEAYKFKGVDERPVYSVDTPPPTVSGKLHVGHIFSFTQSEMLVRYHRLKGENVYYPFGFDDNGLPTERLVEREEGIFAKDLPRSEFIEKCTATKDKYIKEFQDLFKRLGISADWDLGYDTINELSRKVSQRSFIDLVKKGKAYRKEMPVLWCPCCQTSIAQAELENKDVKSYFNYINFSVDNKDLEIATTRPEFLGGCVAIFVNPNDERYKNLIGKTATVPLYNNQVPIIADEKVAIDKGTGVVMCCTFGDQTDMEWQKEYNLPIKKVMQADGTINPEVAIIGGMKTLDARMKIVEELQKQGLLVKSEKIEHSVSTHERCGNEIEIINSPQWYIDILSIKDELIQAADEINWHPESMKTRYLDWVNNLKWDWCISRQRYFGVPFPVWYCKECGDVIIPEDKELPLNPLEHNPHGACKCGCKEFIPETAVMDTWATSSVSPFINMKYGEDDERKFLYPMSMRSHAHEIIRTWTFYSIVKSLYHTGQVPWKDLMISGFVLAKKGEKISKSKNNAKMSPNDLLDTYGADMIRYWTASNKLGTDTWFDTKDIESSKRFMNKLWNSAKFVDMHIKDANLSEETELQSIDKWLISRCHETFEKYQQQMENYEMGLARQEIDKFFWNDLCDNYLEMAKERLYNPDNKHGDPQKAAQQTLATVFLEVLKMYSPFVPHITEYIYQELYKSKLKDELLSTSKFTELPYDKKYIEFGDAMKKIVGDVRKYKTERNLSMKEPIEELKISTSLDNIRCLRDSILDIQSCTSAEHIDIEKSDETEVTITGRNIEDSYIEDAIDAPVQEETKVMKLVRKDKKNQ
jgi:valyl-tRNA synthetase